MPQLPESLLYSGMTVDIAFDAAQPTFGDLFPICGATHPKFPPSGGFAFDSISDLLFDQVDDYFGVRGVHGEGTDVAIWLYPLVDGKPVEHHHGPFDGVRLDYSILRNPERRAEHFLKCVEAFAKLGTGVTYENRKVDLGWPPDLAILRVDIDAVVKHWAEQGIAVGSDEALDVDF